MNRLAASLFCLLFVVAMTPTSAYAGDALPELAGAWIAESLDGDPPPEGAKMVMKFETDEKLRFEVTYEGETDIENLKYEATKDGKLTIYYDPDENPEGDKATWKIVKGKLHLTSDAGELLILKREE